MSGPDILIVGFGNVLMGDDGVGPEVVRRLQAHGLPFGVEAVDAESDSLVLPCLWHGQPEVWMIDAVIRGETPGKIHHVDHDELLSIAQHHATVHHLSLSESLRWIALAYPEMAAVRYRLWGVEPGRIELGTGLSPAATEAAEHVTDEILAAVRAARLGA